MKKFEIGFKAGLIALAIVLTVLIFLLCGNINAGDYKSCIIKYKTDAGLCKQVEDVLNTVDTTIIRDADTTVYYPIPESRNSWESSTKEKDIEKDAVCMYEQYDDSLVMICHRRVVTSRQYRGLAVIDWPLGWYSDYYVADTTAYGKAILTWEEVEK